MEGLVGDFGERKRIQLYEQSAGMEIDSMNCFDLFEVVEGGRGYIKIRIYLFIDGSLRQYLIRIFSLSLVQVYYIWFFLFVVFCYCCFIFKNIVFFIIVIYNFIICFRLI